MGDIKRKDRPQGMNPQQPRGSDPLPGAHEWEVKQRGGDFEVRPARGQESGREPSSPKG
jgi:hypothetical protein